MNEEPSQRTYRWKRITVAGLKRTLSTKSRYVGRDNVVAHAVFVLGRYEWWCTKYGDGTYQLTLWALDNNGGYRTDIRRDAWAHQWTCPDELTLTAVLHHFNTELLDEVTTEVTTEATNEAA